MQENNETTTTKRGAGRPPKIKSDNNEELTLLKSQLQQLQEENLKLKQIAETVSITNTKQLINCTDDEINSLYVNYITTHETAHENALVVEADGKVIIPKSYYVVG
jgi:thiaminase